MLQVDSLQYNWEIFSTKETVSDEQKILGLGKYNHGKLGSCQKKFLISSENFKDREKTAFFLIFINITVSCLTLKWIAFRCVPLRNGKKYWETRVTFKAQSVLANSKFCLSPLCESLQVVPKPFFVVLLNFFSGYDALGILIIHVFFSLLLYRNKVLSKSFSTSVSAKRSSYSCKMLLLSDNRTELMRSISSYQHPRGTVNSFCRHLH